MFGQLETLLIGYAQQLPLEVFAVVASFLEEVIAPIPSAAVMIVTGSFAAVQGYPLYALIVLSMLGSFGKLLGALVVYVVSDKAEDIVMRKFGNYFGVTHEDVESLGRRIGNGLRGYVTLTVLRALPLVPSSLLSIGSGILKVPLRIFIVSTFVGSLVRDFAYIYFGYAGVVTLGVFLEKSTTIESLLQILALVGFLIGLVYIYYRRTKIAE